MNRLASSVAVAALLLSVAGPGLAQDSAATAPADAQAKTRDVTADTVVATVDGKDITIGQMIALRAGLPAQYTQLPDDVLFKGILDQLIQQVSIAAEGEKDVTPRDEVMLDVQRTGYLAGKVLQQAAADAVTDEALQKAFDEKYGQTEPGTEYHAAHILVASEDEAKQVKADLDGGKDFAEEAKEKSTGPSGPNGGDLGWFGTGMMVKPFEDAVIALKPGDVSEPVQTQFGWHVIKLMETRPAQPPQLDDVRDELAQEIQQQAVSDRIAEITGNSEIKRDDEGIDPSVLKDDTILGK